MHEDPAAESQVSNEDRLIKTEKLIAEIEALIDRIKLLRIRIALYLLLNQM